MALGSSEPPAAPLAADTIDCIASCQSWRRSRPSGMLWLLSGSHAGPRRSGARPALRAVAPARLAGVVVRVDDRVALAAGDEPAVDGDSDPEGDEQRDSERAPEERIAEARGDRAGDGD